MRFSHQRQRLEAEVTIRVASGRVDTVRLSQVEAKCRLPDAEVTDRVDYQRQR